MKYLVLAVLSLSAVTLASETERKPKVFSLFNVVQFDNGECRSTSTIASSSTGSTHRNGTCFTQNECTDKGGSAQGTCAAGFGVCCVFTLEKGGTINQNCTYIRNPNYPNAYTETGNVQYIVNKCSHDVCFLRLDFENFNIAGPISTTEQFQIGHPCRDTFTATATSGIDYPTICGINNGQHMYVDLGRENSDSATLAFTFGSVAGANRQWEIKVTQVKCGHAAPHPGCLQYFVGYTGRFTTFNYEGTNGHLENQEYSACIRQEAGFCCVEFMQCQETSSFTIGGGHIDPTAPMAKLDSECHTLDYIGLEASGGDCSYSDQTNLHSKYCGNLLNPFTTGTIPGPVCDCTAPFQIDVFTNNRGDMNAPPAATVPPNTYFSKGACIEWRQIPCN